MKSGQNDVFRILALRDPEPVYVAEPTKDPPDVEVLDLLSPLVIDIEHPDPKIPGLVAQVKVWKAQDLTGSTLASTASQIASQQGWKAADLNALQRMESA